LFRQTKLFIEKDHVIAIPRWQRAAARKAVVVADRLSRNKSMIAQT
jgi:hypothetical protein